MKLKRLDTWGGRGQFQYRWVGADAEILYGAGFSRRDWFPRSLYHNIIQEFSRQEVKVGTSYRKPPDDSIGGWIVECHSEYWGLMSYIAAILLHEGKAERGSKRDLIRLK